MDLIEPTQIRGRNRLNRTLLPADRYRNTLSAHNTGRKDRQSQLTVRRIERPGVQRIRVENDRIAATVTRDSEHTRRRSRDCGIRLRQQSVAVINQKPSWPLPQSSRPNKPA